VIKRYDWNFILMRELPRSDRRSEAMFFNELQIGHV